MTNNNTQLPTPIAAWVEEVSDCWRRIGVNADEQVGLRGDLESDLRQALADGAPTGELVAEDPRAFAAAVADRREGSRFGRSRLTTSRLTSAALAGTVVGAVVAYATVYPALDRLILAFPNLLRHEALLALVAHAVAAAFCVVAGGLAVWFVFRQHRGVRRIVIAASTSLLVAGLVSVAPAIALAAAFHFRTDATVVASVIALVLICCAFGLAAGAHRAVRRLESHPR